MQIWGGKKTAKPLLNTAYVISPRCISQFKFSRGSPFLLHDHTNRDKQRKKAVDEVFFTLEV